MKFSLSTTGAKRASRGQQTKNTKIRLAELYRKFVVSKPMNLKFSLYASYSVSKRGRIEGRPSSKGIKLKLAD